MTNHTTTTIDPKLDAVTSMYAAFGRGDVDTVLAGLADDVDWVAAPGSDAAPWFGAYRGTSEVPHFFQALAAHVDVTEFAPLTFTTNDSDVIVAIRWAYTVRATGRTASMVMYHWWHFDNGLVTMVRTLEDTAQARDAFRP